MRKDLQRFAKHDVYTFQLEALKVVHCDWRSVYFHQDFKQVVDTAYIQYSKARKKLREALDKHADTIEKAGDRLTFVCAPHNVGKLIHLQKIAKIYKAQFRFEKLFIGFLEELDEYCRIRHDYAVDILEQTHDIQSTLFQGRIESIKQCDSPRGEGRPTSPPSSEQSHGPPTNLSGVLSNKLYLKVPHFPPLQFANTHLGFQAVCRKSKRCRECVVLGRGFQISTL